MLPVRKRQMIDTMPSPLLAVLVNALGASYRVKRYSLGMRRALSHWSDLEALDEASLREYQLARLQHVVRAAARTPYYQRVFREAGFDPSRVTSADDLAKLPILDKHDLRAHGKDMVVPGYASAVVTRRSSGTTGEPVSYVQPRRMAYDYDYAMLYQFYAWHGFGPLGRRATLAGRYMGHKRRGVAVRNWPENQLLLGVHSLTSSSVSRYLNALDSFKPELVQAHPSALALLRQLTEQAKLPPPRIPLVTFTAETLPESERHSLSEWLGHVPIFGTYGSGENVVAGGECRRLDGYHLHPAVGICELVGRDVSPEVVGTSLLNDVMPLLRYRTGDVASGINNSPCDCGCTWPRLMGIQGRADDFIYRTDGTAIPPVVLRTGITALGVLKSPFSLVQHVKPASYTLIVYDGVANAGDSIATTRDDLLLVTEYLKRLLGDNSEIGISHEHQTNLLTARGKHRVVIRETE